MPVALTDGVAELLAVPAGLAVPVGVAEGDEIWL